MYCKSISWGNNVRSVDTRKTQGYEEDEFRAIEMIGRRGGSLVGGIRKLIVEEGE